MASKPQVNYAPGTTKDDLMSPGYVLDPLLPYLYGDLWESAVGDGHLAKTLRAYGYRVYASGFASSLARNEEDYLAGYTPPGAWDIQVTNLPFSLKVPWLKRAFALGKPFALLMQDDTPSLGGWQEMVIDLHPQPGLLWYSPRPGFMTPNKAEEFIPNEGWTWWEKDKQTGKMKKVHSSAQFGTLWITWKLGFEGNVWAPQKHWKRPYRLAWERWHLGDPVPFPGALHAQTH